MQAYYLLCATVPYELGQLLRSACTVVQTKTFFLERKKAGTGPFVCPEVTHAGYQTKKTDGGMR